MNGIINYAFYGEDGDPQQGDLLHCETLRVRSVVHDWHIRPHRHHGMHQFFWVSAGGGVASIDGVERPIEPLTAMSVPPMSVHGFVFEPGIEGWVITMPAANLAAILANSNRLAGRLRAPAIFTAHQSAEAIFAGIAEEFARFSPERDLALGSLVGLLAVWFAREIAAAPGPTPAVTDRGRDLFMRFVQRIEGEFASHKPVAHYACEMGVTPTHLSRVCRSIAGRPALALIQDRLALESRRQLTYTARSVSEIAYALGFQDPAHFSKFFRKQTGQSPSAFRLAVQDRVPMSR